MQKPPPFVLTEAVHTTAIAPPNTTIIRGTSPTLPHSGMFGIPTNVVVNSREFTAHSMKIASEFQTRIEQLAQSIEQDLAATRLEAPTHPVPPAQAISRELGVRHTLILRKTAEFHQKTALAHQFFGDNPLTKNFDDYFRKARSIDSTVNARGIAMQAWVTSYKAAHEANLLSQSIQMLNQQQVEVNKWLAAVQADDQARLAAEQEAQRAAAELARINEQAAARAREQTRLVALAEAQRVAVEQARVADEAAAQQVAAEQARLVALAEAQRLAAEQVRIAAEAATQQAAAEQARLEAQAEIKRETEKAREAKEAQELARFMAMVAMFKSWETSRPFPVSGSAAAAGPVFTLATGRLAAGAATTQAVRTALQTGVAAVTTASSALIVGFAALLFPSPLGNGESRELNIPLADLVPDNLHAWSLSLSEYEPDSLHALSVPLWDFTPYDPDDLYAVAEANERVRLPVAIGSRTLENKTEFFVAATNGTTVPGDVPVRLATLDSSLNVYRSYNPDAPSIGMTWTPIVRPKSASTALPASQPNIAVYDGTTLKALEGRTDTFPEFDLYSFGGFVTVFPADSGIPPIFTLFKDRRDDPGVASGYGEPVLGIWLESASQGTGVVISNRIADKLRGQHFSSFKDFREEFWRVAIGDPELSPQFSANNFNEMKNGRAPFTRKNDRLGGRVKFELHHITPVAEGGSVYDIENMRVITPKRHSKIHNGENKHEQN